jgi:hypothetical protein
MSIDQGDRAREKAALEQSIIKDALWKPIGRSKTSGRAVRRFSQSAPLRGIAGYIPELDRKHGAGLASDAVRPYLASRVRGVRVQQPAPKMSSKGDPDVQR